MFYKYLTMAHRDDQGGSNDNSAPVFFSKTPEDFKYRKAAEWREGEGKAPPPAQADFRMVRLWSGRRCYYRIAEHELPAFREWLAYEFAGTLKKPSRVITGRRCIYVVRITPFIAQKLGRPNFKHGESFEYIKARLIAILGDKAERFISDFLN